VKLLLDECVTRFVKRDLADHEVHTVEEADFKGLENGDLLRAASGTYEALITVDQIRREIVPTLRPSPPPKEYFRPDL
jgi:hypothetical protein